jgi:hypothetical protein
MALKRLVRQEGAAGNVVDDVSVKHASSSDAVGTITPSQIASASALNDINSNYIKTIKVNGIVQPKTNNEVNLPQWQTINDLVIKNSPTDVNPVIYNGSGAVTLDLSQKVVVGDVNTLLLQHGGTTNVTYNGKAPGPQTFNINTLTVNQGSSANQTTYNGGNAKTLNLETLKFQNSSGTDIAGGTYNTSGNVTLRYPNLKIRINNVTTTASLDPSPSTTTQERVLDLGTVSASVGQLTLQQNGTTVGTYSGAATTVNFTTFSTLNLGSATWIQGPGWSNNLAANFNGYRAITIMFSHVESDSSYAISSATFPLSSIIGGDRLRVVVVENGTIKWISLTPTTSPSLNQVTNWTISSSGSNWPNGTGILIVGMR